jgi:hypothetical protein
VQIIPLLIGLITVGGAIAAVIAVARQHRPVRAAPPAPAPVAPPARVVPPTPVSMLRSGDDLDAVLIDLELQPGPSIEQIGDEIVSAIERRSRSRSLAHGSSELRRLAPIRDSFATGDEPTIVEPIAFAHPRVR